MAAHNYYHINYPINYYYYYYYYYYVLYCNVVIFIKI